MKDVQLDLLWSFVAYAESSNMREAAQKLGLTQPTLSLQIQRLEEAFPEPLFVLSGRKKVLSRFGRALLEVAKPRIAEVHKSVSTLSREFGDEAHAVLRVGARVEIFHRVVSLLSFKSRVELHALPREQILKRITGQELDLGVVREKPDSPDLIAKKLFSDHAKFIVHRDLLPRATTVEDAMADSEFLLRTPFIAYNRELPYLAQWFAHKDVEPPRAKVSCEDWRTVKQLVAMKIGWSIVPSGIDVGDIPAQEAPIPSRILPATQYYLVYHKDLRQSRLITGALRGLVK